MNPFENIIVKLFANIMLAVALSVGIGSCSREEPDFPPTPVAKTMLVYMPWSASETSTSGGLYEQFLKNLDDIESAIVAEGGLGDTRLLVAIADNYRRVDLFEITFNGQRCVRDTLRQYTDPQYSSSAWLTTLFDDVAAKSPAHTYALLIGAHGTGWLPPGSKPHQVRAFGGRTQSTQAAIETLATAIGSSQMKRMEYICFDDCYMSNIETAYTLRDVTQYLIASTSEVMDAGIPYADAWKYLYARPDYVRLCETFLQYYQNYPLPYGTLSVVDCGKVESLAVKMREINRTAVITEDRVAAVQPLDGFNKTVFYDFGDYVAHVCDDAATVEAMQSAIADAIVATCCTPRLYSVYLNNLDHTYEVRTTSGLTISDPSVNSTAIENKKLTGWWEATH